MIQRKNYVDKLISLKDKDVIKVITGIRRCGKSTVFKLYQAYLLENGIEQNQIQTINFEGLESSDLLDYKKLHQHIVDKLVPNKMNYIFLDEIQNVPQFQKAVDSLYIKDNVDVYITGSNAFILSGELATLLAGRYIEIKMMPLSFKEYQSYYQSTDVAALYASYITNSAFPYTIFFNNDTENINNYLEGIFNTILIKDIASRKNLVNINALQRVIQFMAGNIGSLVSIKKIADTMTSAGQKIATHTIDDYLSALCESYIFYQAPRFDIKGKEYLKTGAKYYIADVALRRFLLTDKRQDFGHILENIIFLELHRRGYKVYVGKYDDKEVDFVAIKNEHITYYQVALSVMDEKTLQRELAPLQGIKNHHPKILLTLDPLPSTPHNGIWQHNALDWLLGKV